MKIYLGKSKFDHNANLYLSLRSTYGLGLRFIGFVFRKFNFRKSVKLKQINPLALHYISSLILERSTSLDLIKTRHKIRRMHLRFVHIKVFD